MNRKFLLVVLALPIYRLAFPAEKPITIKIGLVQDIRGSRGNWLIAGLEYPLDETSTFQRYISFDYVHAFTQTGSGGIFPLLLNYKWQGLPDIFQPGSKSYYGAGYGFYFVSPNLEGFSPGAHFAWQAFSRLELSQNALLELRYLGSTLLKVGGFALQAGAKF